MIGRHGVIEDSQAESLLSFIQPGDPFSSVTDKLQKKLLLVTTVGNVPQIPGNEISIGSRHGRLKRSILGVKTSLLFKQRRIQLLLACVVALPLHLAKTLPIIPLVRPGSLDFLLSSLVGAMKSLPCLLMLVSFNQSNQRCPGHL